MKPSSMVLDCGSSVVVTSGWSSMITTPTVTEQKGVQIIYIQLYVKEQLERGIGSWTFSKRLVLRV